MSAPGGLHHLSDAERNVITKNKVKNEHTLIDFKVTPMGSTHGNLGQYFHVDFTVQESKGETRKHRLFMKTMPADSWQTEFLVNDGLFQKEVNFYKNLSGCLRKFLSTDVYPECFLVDTGKIVMTDAASLGYRPLKDLVEPLDYEHTKAGLEALARLHAAGIIYEETTGRKLESDFPASADEAYYAIGRTGMAFVRSGAQAIEALVPHLDTNQHRDPDAVDQLKDQIRPWIEKLEFYLNEDSPHRRVICHGDSWPANFLFRYDGQGKPESAMIVDFQMTRSRSPAVDVNTFMYLSVPTDDLKKWRESLLDAYYKVLAQEMRNCGLDADKIYPKEEFLKAYIYYQIVGIIYALCYFPFSRIRPEIIAERTPTPEKAWQFFFVERRQHTIDCYKDCALLRRFLNGATSELDENFVKTKRGLTELTH